MKKSIIIIVVSLVLNLFSICPTSANSYTDEQKCILLANDIEKNLRVKGTSTSNELRKTITRLEHLLSCTDTAFDDSRIDTVYNLINTTTKLLNYYYLFESNKTEYSKDGNIFLIAAAAIMAWFNDQGYFLSEELLTHAVANTSYYSLYSPVYGNRVNYSAVFYNIKYNNTNTSGSGVFQNVGTTETKDLYYAIHAFTWLRVYGNTIHIEDLYDFTIDKDYWGTIEGWAVSAMVAAQYTGAIVPFYTIIVQ